MNRSIRHWLLTLGLWLIASAALAQGASGFDHLRTGYALSGAHTAARCESCHVGGVFKGTPRDCESCHTAGARFARANVVKNPEHLPTQQTCDSCHNARSFSGARMNHTGVARGTCASCHNSVQAAGKPPTHLRTTASCDSCHGSRAWRPATGFDHAGVAPGTCATCHNGVQATGPGATHTPYTRVAATASANCDTCHRSGFKAWTPARLHTNTSISTQCSTCHLSARPNTAVHTGQTACETCHRGTSTWQGAKVDHSTFNVATVCSSCHNGTAAAGKHTNHIPSGTVNCIACHSTSTWKPSTFNHTQVPVTALCASCHNGVLASGAGATHTPYTRVAATASANCDTCHRSGYRSWLPARLHANTSISTQCSTCHLAARPNTPVHTGQTACETCHRGTSTWQGAKVDHSTFTVATVCSSCHNGTGATGKNPTHIPSGAVNCIACHTTSAWKPSTFNHTQVPVTAQCASCHSGAYPPADGKGAGHLPYQLIPAAATANCDTCHRNSLTTWANGRLHANVTVTGQCKTCHNGSFTTQAAVGKPANHIPEAQLLNGAAMECNSCHLSTATWSVRMNHNNSLGGGAGWCKACHATGTTYAGSMERKALTHRTRVPVPTDCSESGCHRPLGNKGTTFVNWD